MVETKRSRIDRRTGDARRRIIYLDHLKRKRKKSLKGQDSKPRGDKNKTNQAAQQLE